MCMFSEDRSLAKYNALLVWGLGLALVVDRSRARIIVVGDKKRFFIYFAALADS